MVHGSAAQRGVYWGVKTELSLPHHRAVSRLLRAHWSGVYWDRLHMVLRPRRGGGEPHMVCVATYSVTVYGKARCTTAAKFPPRFSPQGRTICFLVSRPFALRIVFLPWRNVRQRKSNNPRRRDFLFPCSSGARHKGHGQDHPITPSLIVRVVVAIAPLSAAVAVNRASRGGRRGNRKVLDGEGSFADDDIRTRLLVPSVIIPHLVGRVAVGWKTSFVSRKMRHNRI